MKPKYLPTIAAALTLMIAPTLATLTRTEAYAQQPQPQPQAPPADGAQVTQPDQGGVNWPGVGYGVGALATNIVYLPAKLVYALLGGLVGGGAYVLTAGNTQTADTIWRSSLGGDYVVTPDMLQGKQQLHFSGPTDTPPETQTGGVVQPIAPASAATPGVAVQSGGKLPSGVPYGSAAQPMDNGAGPKPSSSAGTPPSLPSTTIE